MHSKTTFVVGIHSSGVGEMLLRPGDSAPTFSARAACKGTILKNTCSKSSNIENVDISKKLFKGAQASDIRLLGFS
jgi:hypothetical protein